MNQPIYDQLQRTLSVMLLCEPGSRVEGSTQEILETLFESAWWLLRDEMGDDLADQTSLALLQRVHDAWTQAGLIVKDLP